MGKVAHSSFRYDINGLRAWAVLAVIFFHFGLPGWAGGYVGVDVFFVISGYLMTSIIARALEDGAAARPAHFLWAFFLARAKRIWPALLVMCSALLVAGWFVMSAKELAALGDQIGSAVMFYSNIKFWRETGYFAPSAHSIWLLHTWSLSVEWQFYMLLPVAMLVTWKIHPSKKALLAMLSIGGLASLGLCLYAARVSPGTAFFLLPCRAWEMIAGGLVVLAARPPATPAMRRALELGGLGMISVSILCFGHLVWPDWRALIPVLGTVMVLASARERSIFTGTAPMQWIGTRSYSMYLWHWPLSVGLYYLELRSSPVAVATALLLTALLGHLSYRWVETRLRQPIEALTRGTASVAMACAALAVVLPSAMIYHERGFSQRLPADVNAMFLAAEDHLPESSSCRILENGNDKGCASDGQKVAVLVVGDSHGSALFDAVRKALPQGAGAAVRWTIEGCPLMRGIRFASSQTDTCKRFNEWVLSNADRLYPGVPIVIVNRTSFYIDGPNEESEDEAGVPSIYFDEKYGTRSAAFYQQAQQRLVDTACALTRNRPVFMVRPIPEMGINVPMTIARTMLFGAHRDISLSLTDYQKRHTHAMAAQEAAHAQCNITLLDPVPYLCPDGKCDSVRDRRAMYFDDDHLSLYGASYLAPMFSQVLTPPANHATLATLSTNTPAP